MSETVEQLRPIRLEIAISLASSTNPDAPKILDGIFKLDPVIKTILKQYGAVA